MNVAASAKVGGTKYYDHDQAHLLQFVLAPPSSVLEIGCASGLMLRTLLDRGASRATGVEFVPTVAAEARARCPDARILIGDVAEIPDDILGGEYDLLIVSHVLEHLSDPWQVLRRLVGRLRPGGQVIGALPNIRHWSVTVPLLVQGRWEYVDEGILDRTHLRFFTREGIEALLSGANLEEVVVVPNFTGGKSRLANHLTFGLATGHFAFDYRFSAVKA